MANFMDAGDTGDTLIYKSTNQWCVHWLCTLITISPTLSHTLRNLPNSDNSNNHS